MTPEQGLQVQPPSGADLDNLPITPQSLLKASAAALLYRRHRLFDLVVLVSDHVITGIVDLLSPKAIAQLEALLQRHEVRPSAKAARGMCATACQMAVTFLCALQPQFGITELLWVMASVRADVASGQAWHATDPHQYAARLAEAKASALEMIG